MNVQEVDGRRFSSNFEALDLRFLDAGFRRQSGDEMVLRDDLLDSRAHELGKRFAQEMETRSHSKKPVSVTPTQLRRLFGEMKRLQREVQRADQIDPYLARIRMLKSKVAYAAGRDNVTTAFEQLINRCITMVSDKQSYIDMVLFVESVVGFFQRYKEEGAG